VASQKIFVSKLLQLAVALTSLIVPTLLNLHA
jgi:hypothetical protein